MKEKTISKLSVKLELDTKDFEESILKLIEKMQEVKKESEKICIDADELILKFKELNEKWKNNND
jgi:hypothetical protein